MTLPQSKMNELMDKLTHYINLNVAIGEFELASIRRDIKQLPEEHERVMLNAFAVGASQNVEAAKIAFEEAFTQYPDFVTAMNLKAYLAHVSDYPKLTEVVYFIADSYDSIDFVKDAVEHSLFRDPDLERYQYYVTKYMKYLNSDQQELETERFSPVLNHTTSCIERAGVSAQDLSRVSEHVRKVSHLKKLSLVGNQISVQGGNLTMLVFVGATSPEALCDANLELAMNMGEDELVFDKPVTAFFKESLSMDTTNERKG